MTKMRGWWWLGIAAMLAFAAPLWADDAADIMDQSLQDLQASGGNEEDQAGAPAPAVTSAASNSAVPSSETPSVENTGAAPDTAAVSTGIPAPENSSAAAEPAASPDDVSSTAAQLDAQTSETAAPQTPAEPAVSAPAAEPVRAKDVLPEEQKPAASDDEEVLEEGKSLPASREEAAAKGEILLADFDSGDKPNNLGGDFGGWDKDPNDDTQGCKMSFASDDASGNIEGYALRLDYDVDSPNPSYNGFWMKLENLDATPYDTLSFYVRGASQRWTKRMKVELKTPDHRSGDFMISGIKSEWQKVEIPLRRFKGVKDWTILSEMILVFDDINVTPKKGTILVDQIMLVRKEGGMPRPAGKEPAENYVLSDDEGPAEVVGQTEAQ